MKLRALEPQDLDTLYLIENDPESWEEGITLAPMSRYQLKQYILSYDANPFSARQLRLVACTDDDTVVGFVDIYEVDEKNRRAGVGIVIDRQHRRKGYGREALRMLGDYAFSTLGLHQLWAVVGEDNEASRRTFESAGYKTAGCLRSWIRSGRKYKDALIYQLFE